METNDEKDCYDEKAKAYYTSTLNTWYTIRLEKDKQLLTLSITALGFLITLLRTVGITSSFDVFCFSIAIFFFFVTIILILFSFEKNSIYLKEILLDEDPEEKIIIRLDKIISYCFVLAMFSVFLIGTSTLFYSFQIREVNMNHNSHRPKVQKMLAQPNKGDTLGVQGAKSLKPKLPKPNQSGSSREQKKSEGDGNKSEDN